MSSIIGMTPTGRSMLGPASDLVELKDEDGVIHTAVVFHKEWRSHPAITDALSVIVGFLESPLVTGLVELVAHDREQGAFVYPTGTVRSVAELVRSLSDAGRVGGVRAGLELMYTAGQILVEGAEAGESQGVYSHGGLTPRRIMIKPDGQVMVIGHGLPQVEILQFHQDSSQIPREDSFRYCPPERIEARSEQLSSDLFALGLIAFEVMTGKPVYDGLVNDIRQQAARGEGSRRLFRFREVLPEGVRNLLTKVLRPDADARYISGEDFLTDVHALLADRSVPGSSLLGLMEVLDSGPVRTGGALQQGSTQMVSADQLRQQLEPDPAPAPVGRIERPLRESAPVVSEELPTVPERGASAPEPAEPEETPEPAKRWSKVRRQVRRVRRTEPEEKLSEPSVSSEAIGGMAAGEEESAVPAPPQVPRRPVRRTQAPRTESLPNPPDVQDSLGEDRSPTNADDLLLQIRGRRSKSESVARSVSSERTAMFKRGEVMEVTMDDSESDDSATMMMTPEQLRAKLASSVPPEVAPKGVAPPSVLNDKSHAVQVLDLRGNRFTVHVDAGATVAAAILSMVGDIVPLPLDQMGGLQGWYRLERDGERIDPGGGSVELTGRPTQLVWIAAGTRVVEVCVRSGTKDVRFSNPMSTAVPVRSLVRFLSEWLSLPDGDWGMYSEQSRFDDGSILADVEGAGPLSVELKLRDS